MNELTSDQLKRITKSLMDCAPFSNEPQLRTLFIDLRIRPWQHLIPSQPENFYDLVKRIIAILIDRRNRDRENALVLFLDVLADNIDEGDYCHGQIISLASELKPTLNFVPPPPDPQPKTANDRYELYAILEDRFNDSEIRDLCFHLNITYENLPGSTKKDKARELVTLMERRNALDELAETIQQIRLDILEVPPVIQVIEAAVPLLHLTLEGTLGKWTLHATNESDEGLNKINIVFRPSPAVTVSPNKIQLGAIQSRQTKQTAAPVVIRPNQTSTGDICVLPFEVIYATPNARPKRYKSEFHIPITTN